MAPVAGVNDKSDTRAIHATLCIDSEALDRFGSVIRHLVVGLVDQAVHVRLVSSDTRIEGLSLGPVQTHVHQRLTWPFAKKRSEEMLDALSAPAPTIVHALSRGSYEIAGLIAETFDADLVLQVTSRADMETIAVWTGQKVRRYLAFSQPIANELGDQLTSSSNDIRVIRPGVQASKQVACFTHPERIPTVLCSSAFDRDSGIDLLIEAVDMFRSRDRQVMVFLLGEGNKESYFRRMIRERKLSSWITLVNPMGDLTQAMRSADIFVRPNPETAISADVLEAMGSGMVIVSLASPICDHLHHDQTAIVAEDSAQSLAQVMEDLMNDPPHARTIAAAGIEYIRTHHSMSSMAQHTADAYRELALARKTLSLPE